MKNATTWQILFALFMGLFIGGAIVNLIAWDYWRKKYGKQVLLYFKYRPGSGQIKKYEYLYFRVYSEEEVIKVALDEHNIPYKFARVTKEEKVAMKGEHTEWVYTIEYWE